MKTNMQMSHDLSRFGNEKHKTNESLLKILLSEVKQIKSDMTKYTFRLHMNCVDIAKFFPLESDDKLEEFMDRSHEDWDARKNSFYDMLYNTVTTKRKRLACGLLHLIFTRNFIGAHKWPMSGG